MRWVLATLLVMAGCGVLQEDGATTDTGGKADCTDCARFVVQPYLQQVTTSSACIFWQATGAAAAQVIVRASGEAAIAQTTTELRYGRLCASGLRENTQYAYSVVLRDGTGRVLALSPTTRFVTARARYEQLRFNFISDTQTYESAHDNVIAPVNRFDPDLVINGGDLVEDGSSDKDAESYARVMQQYGATRPVYAVVGNHDYPQNSVDGDVDLTRFFRLHRTGGNDQVQQDGQWYSVRRDFVQFFFLNSNLAKLERKDKAAYDAQLRWFRRELAATCDGRDDPLLVVAVWHHAGHSSGLNTTAHMESGDAATRYVREQFIPIIEAGPCRVHLVLNGHEHLYERSAKAGVTYMTAGPAGGIFGPKVSANAHRCGGAQMLVRTVTDCAALRPLQDLPARIVCTTYEIPNAPTRWVTGIDQHAIDTFTVSATSGSTCAQ